MGAARDVEHQAGRTGQRHEGRIAFRPVCNGFEKRLVARRVHVGDAEVRHHRARIGQCLAAGQAAANGGFVEGDDAERASDLGRDDDMRVR